MTHPSTPHHTGGCRCGAIRFAASADPHFASLCHCEDCRRASGAPFLSFVGFYRSEVSFDGGEGRGYGSGPTRRSFCETCGAPIAYYDTRLPDRIYFNLGAMDAPHRYEPTLQAYAAERLPFACIAIDLPARDKGGVPRP
ncbi:GFA family protein [Jiella mangrovi]|uniref:GFA family protein n=1 Tax=Jiella mangrovi TaxID=2821407 RepID=A0ABS4BJV0_9HYPH|nr:GFA family protein [Jiella mangrovi]MBP0616279.1 GFA family protein [Jiella mangrovi]